MPDEIEAIDRRIIAAEVALEEDMTRPALVFVNRALERLHPEVPQRVIDRLLIVVGRLRRD